MQTKTPLHSGFSIRLDMAFIHLFVCLRMKKVITDLEALVRAVKQKSHVFSQLQRVTGFGNNKESNLYVGKFDM